MKFEIVESHEDEKIKYVDEVAVIKAIKDGREAMREFTKCKNGQLVYSTENESIEIEKVKLKKLYYSNMNIQHFYLYE